MSGATSLLAEAWRRGEARSLLLDSGQQSWVEAAESCGGDSVWMVGRQRGKSFAALGGLADTLCRRVPGAIVRYAAKTAKSAEAIVGPTLEQWLETCPPHLRPVERRDKGQWLYPSGSTLVWAGTDNEQFERLRGPRAHLVLLDESAFYARLEAVESALLPQLTTTGGRALYLSTPPLSPSHGFVARYRAAQAAGRAVHDTIEGNPRLGPEGVRAVLSREASRLGQTLEEFRASTYCRREYYADLVTEESRAAIPSWPERARELTRECQRPQYYDGYAGYDWGFGDPHAGVAGYLDYERQTLVVEHEFEARGANTSVLAERAKQLEAAAWGTDVWQGKLYGAKDWEMLPDFLRTAAAGEAPRQPYLRVGDDDLLVLADLHQLHGLCVLPTRKDDARLAVNEVDVLVREGRLNVHPRCTRLLEQLASTCWNARRSDFERTPRDHGDVLKALVYLARNVRWHRDPRPRDRLAELGLSPPLVNRRPQGLEVLGGRRSRVSWR